MGMGPFAGRGDAGKMFKIEMLARKMGVHPLMVLQLLARRDQVHIFCLH